MNGAIQSYIGHVTDIDIFPIQRLIPSGILICPDIKDLLPVFIGVIILRAGPPVRGFPGLLVAHVRRIFIGFQVLAGGEQYFQHFFTLLVVDRTITWKHQIAVNASFRRCQINQFQLILYKIQGISSINRLQLIDFVMQTGNCKKISALAVEMGQEAVIMCAKSGHGDFLFIAQFPGIFIIGIELEIGVKLLCIIKHHVFLDIQLVGITLCALFDLAGNQCFHINGASFLQHSGLSHILFHIRLFPVRPNTGIYGYKFTGSHNYLSFLAWYLNTGAAL